DDHIQRFWSVISSIGTVPNVATATGDVDAAPCANLFGKCQSCLTELEVGPALVRIGVKGIYPSSNFSDRYIGCLGCLPEHPPGSRIRFLVDRRICCPIPNCPMGCNPLLRRTPIPDWPTESH